MRPSILPAALLSVASPFCPPSTRKPLPTTNPTQSSSLPWPKRSSWRSSEQIFFAIDAYKKASKIAAGKDADCLEALRSPDEAGSYKDAAATATALEAIATTPADKSTPKPSAATPSSFRPETRTSPIS